MKRLVAHALLGLTGLILAGCPIYPQETQCFDNYDCPADYYCSDRGYCVRPSIPSTGGSGGSAAASACSSPADCGINETCAADGKCHVGDCSFWNGCVAPYECVLDGYTYQCLLPGSDASTGGSGGSTGGAGGSSGGTGGTSATGGAAGSSGGAAGQAGNGGTAGAGGAAEAAAPIYCGNPSDCAAGETCAPIGVCLPGTCSTIGCITGYYCDGAVPPKCAPSNSAACIKDSDCAPLGADYKCIAGMCAAPADQCADKTQCPSPDTHSCVEGKCITSCSLDSDCPQPMRCDMALGVCTVPATACTVTNDCGDVSKVCVDGACASKCGAGGACDAGLVCVGNGCVPNNAPDLTTCTTEGVQSECQTNSICLHHSCYIACSTTPSDSCEFLEPGLNVCKQVVTSTGTYQVCGSSTNLGNECDPTVGGCTSGKVCIDGYCR